jgi:hypothetical protein
MWGTPYYDNSADSYAERGLTPSRDAKDKGGRGQQASGLNESRSALISRAPFGYPN